MDWQGRLSRGLMFMDRIKVEGLTEEERAWYEGLDEEDLKKLEKAYFEKVYERRGPIGKIPYFQFVKVCSAVAVRLHKKQSRKEEKALKRLERLGR
jgi:hypothetical protein